MVPSLLQLSLQSARLVDLWTLLNTQDVSPKVMDIFQEMLSFDRIYREGDLTTSLDVDLFRLLLEKVEITSLLESYGNHPENLSALLKDLVEFLERPGSFQTNREYVAAAMYYDMVIGWSRLDNQYQLIWWASQLNSHSLVAETLDQLLGHIAKVLTTPNETSHQSRRLTDGFPADIYQLSEKTREILRSFPEKYHEMARKIWEDLQHCWVKVEGNFLDFALKSLFEDDTRIYRLDDYLVLTTFRDFIYLSQEDGLLILMILAVNNSNNVWEMVR